MWWVRLIYGNSRIRQLNKTSFFFQLPIFSEPGLKVLSNAQLFALIKWNEGLQFKLPTAAKINYSRSFFFITGFDKICGCLRCGIIFAAYDIVFAGLSSDIKIFTDNLNRIIFKFWINKVSMLIISCIIFYIMSEKLLLRSHTHTHTHMIKI